MKQSPPFLFLFYFKVFVVAQTVQRRMRGWYWIMNWKGCVRKRLWHKRSYYPGCCLEGLRKTTTNLIQDCRSPGPDLKSPPWEASSRSHSQGILSVLRELKVHYLVLKTSPLGPVLCKSNPVNTIISCYFKLRFNIILPSTSRCLRCIFPSRLKLYMHFLCPPSYG
jgi:hypothetical protein